MKALTISPPWPFAIFHLGKDCENRVWTPAPSKLKPGDWFLVHGGRSPFTGKGTVQDTDYGSMFQTALSQLITDINSGKIALTAEQKAHLKTLGTKLETGGYKFDLTAFHMPGIIGAVEYLGFKKGHESYWAAKSRPWEKPQIQWLLGRRVLFPEPIPCGGQLQLWDVPETIHKQAQELYKQAMRVGT